MLFYGIVFLADSHKIAAITVMSTRTSKNLVCEIRRPETSHTIKVLNESARGL